MNSVSFIQHKALHVFIENLFVVFILTQNQNPKVALKYSTLLEGEYYGSLSCCEFKRCCVVTFAP